MHEYGTPDDRDFSYDPFYEPNPPGYESDDPDIAASLAELNYESGLIPDEQYGEAIEVEPPAPEIAWKNHDIAALDWAEIEDFTIIGGINSFRDFSRVEAAICESLSQEVTVRKTQTVHAIDGDPQIARNRIGNVLRPKGYNGRLQDGRALVHPLNPTFVKEQPSLFRRISAKAPEEIMEDYAGYMVTYTAELRSSRGLRQALSVDTAYFAARDHRERHQNRLSGVTHRIVGKMALTQFTNDLERDRQYSQLIGTILQMHSVGRLHHCPSGKDKWQA